MGITDMEEDPEEPDYQPVGVVIGGSVIVDTDDQEEAKEKARRVAEIFSGEVEEGIELQITETTDTFNPKE